MLKKADREPLGARTMEQPARLLRPADVEREYHLSNAWLRKRRWLGLPPAFVRIGRMVFYQRTALDSFVESQRVGPGEYEERR